MTIVQTGSFVYSARLLERGPLASSASTARASVSAGRRLLRPLVAHCYLGLGKLHRRTGKREQARDHLSTATTMYREMDMRFWLEKAKAATEESA